jgi:hypothetical protein
VLRGGSVVAGFGERRDHLPGPVGRTRPAAVGRRGIDGLVERLAGELGELGRGVARLIDEQGDDAARGGGRRSMRCCSLSTP